jgi:hypothetical protein
MDKTDGGFDAAKFAQHFNQFSPEYGPHFRDISRHMRAHCPVAHTDEVGGFWVLTRYAYIERVARDDEAFSSLYGILPSANPEPPKGVLAPLGGERTGPLAVNRPGPNGEAPRLSFHRRGRAATRAGTGHRGRLRACAFCFHGWKKGRPFPHR